MKNLKRKNIEKINFYLGSRMDTKTINCTNCGVTLTKNEIDSSFECAECGTIIYDDGTTERFGITEYEFPDIDYVYKHVFHSNKEIDNFIDYVNKNLGDYSRCEIFLPTGYIKLI